MSILPLLPAPGIEAGRPAAGLLGTTTAMIQLGARVVGLVGSDPLIETGHGRALLHGAPALRAGADLVLELPHRDAALAHSGRLVAIEGQRLEPPLPIRMQPEPPSQAVTVRSAAPLEVSVRALGPDGRPLAPAFTARLSVPLAESASPGSGTAAVPSGEAAIRAGLLPATSGPGAGASPIDAAVAPVTGRPAAAPAALPAGPPANAADPSSTVRMPFAADGGGAAHGQVIAATMLPRDALGRSLLRAAGVTWQVEPLVDLPAGARLQLSLPAGLPGSSAALQAGPLEAARTLAAWLGDRAEMTEPSHAAARLPEPSATLAARLLRLVQLIAPRPPDGDARRPAAPASTDGQPGGARVTAALAELGRLAGEPQSGGWRVLLLPLGFAGAPLLRLYVREDPCAQDGGRKDWRSQPRETARRAVFELEFGELGRCQIDVLCQARRFDLLVRTARPLPADVRRDVRELYLAARDLAGLAGAMRFRAGQLLVLPEPGARPGGITV
jgi:hypothetical protein